MARIGLDIQLTVEETETLLAAIEEALGNATDRPADL